MKLETSPLNSYQLSTLEKASIMLAYVAGEPVEYSSYNLKFKGWYRATNPNWDWTHANYRIKDECSSNEKTDK